MTLHGPIIHHGDCLAVLRTLPDESVAAVVTDPPYGLSNTDPKHVAETLTKWVTGDHEYTPPVKGGGFMGKTWDSFVPPPAVWDECMRVLKPGGHLLVFAGTRTQDLMGLSIRLAGFDIRDGIGWIYGSGFPKSRSIDKDIDRNLGVLRERRPMQGGGMSSGTHNGWNTGPASHSPTAPLAGTIADSTPATPEAERWAGWGTALKPAIEPVIVARKPIKGTVAANVLAHGTGGINVDACRVATTDNLNGGAYAKVGGRTESASLRAGSGMNVAGKTTGKDFEQPDGRFPPNVLLDPEAAAAMDEQSGILAVAGNKPDSLRTGTKDGPTKPRDSQVPTYTGGPTVAHKDRGGASRFFPVFKYQAKAPAKERPQHTAEDGTVVKHPTVKPLDLMRWLVRLVTPPGGIILDPFAGSGTTGEAAMLEGFDSILIEGEAEYLPLIDARITRVRRHALLEALREADSRSSLEQIFYQDASSGSPVWSDDCTAASKERLKDLARKDA